MISPSYVNYCQVRLDCGWDAGFAMVEEVWNNLSQDGRDSAMQQYDVFASAINAEREAHGKAWGTF